MSTLATLATVRRSWDSDAGAYIKAVESADQQQLELAVAQAINQFVLGCKKDGVWTAIKQSCILIGARTLAGALTALVGNNATNNNFVSGDYARKTGLIGNGTTKYLTATNPATPAQDSAHQSIYISGNTTIPNGLAFATHLAEWPTSGTNGRTQLTSDSGRTFTRSRENTGNTVNATSTEFLGTSRAAGASYTLRRAGADTTVNVASSGAPNQTIYLFANPGLAQYSDARLAFFSVGESLTLSLLDTRVSNLYTAIGNAIA